MDVTASDAHELAGDAIDMAVPAAPEVTGSTTEAAGPDLPRVPMGSEDLASDGSPAVLATQPSPSATGDAGEDMQDAGHVASTTPVEDTAQGFEQPELRVGAAEPQEQTMAPEATEPEIVDDKVPDEAVGLPIPGVRYARIRAQDASRYAVDGKEPRFIAEPGDIAGDSRRVA